MYLVETNDDCMNDVLEENYLFLRPARFVNVGFVRCLMMCVLI